MSKTQHILAIRPGWLFTYICWCLQGGRRGGFSHPPIRPYSLWRDALLDRLADPIHPRLWQTHRREAERNSQWHLLADGHPGAGPRAAAKQWVCTSEKLTTLVDRWSFFFFVKPELNTNFYPGTYELCASPKIQTVLKLYCSSNFQKPCLWRNRNVQCYAQVRFPQEILHIPCLIFFFFVILSALTVQSLCKGFSLLPHEAIWVE